MGEAQRSFARRRYEARKAAGLCISCGQPKDTETVHCHKCKSGALASGLRARRKRIANGQCGTCGEPAIPGRYACAGCTSKMAVSGTQRRRNRIANGLCPTCGDPAEVHKSCFVCWLASAAGKATKDWRNGPAVGVLLESQGRRCALTGDMLIPGMNATLDHIQPTSRGGAYDLNNVWWVTSRANAMKTDMSPAEFVEMCRRVIAYHEQNAVVT